MPGLICINKFLDFPEVENCGKNSIMKLLIPVLLFSIAAFPMFGQIGVSAAYNSLNFNPDEVSVADDLTFSGVSISANYWFRLENVRIEFLPGLGYTNLESDISEIDFYQAFVTTRVYPFSFWDDCDCPTFSKQSGFFKDGFFLSLTPFLNRYELQMDDSELFGETKYDDWAFSLDIGAGLDIGLSDYITITPEVRYRYFPDIAGLMTEPGSENLTESGNLNGVYAGMGLIFRWRH